MCPAEHRRLTQIKTKKTLPAHFRGKGNNKLTKCKHFWSKNTQKIKKYPRKIALSLH